MIKYKPLNSLKENLQKHYMFTNSSERLESSYIKHNENILKTNEQFLTNYRKNIDFNLESKNINIMTENSFMPITVTDYNHKNNIDSEINKSSDIRLEDGISINIIKSHGEKRIKTFFHIPDFEMYIVKVN